MTTLDELAADLDAVDVERVRRLIDAVKAGTVTTETLHRIAASADPRAAVDAALEVCAGS